MTGTAEKDGEPEGAGTACATCLRRGMLVGVLAARIADRLGSERRNPSAVLALDDETLVAALTGAADRERARAFLASFDHAQTQSELERVRVAAICRHSIGYPTRLLQLHDPPAVLFIRGRITEGFGALSRGPAVAIVGSRNASSHALEMARELGRGLSAAGVTVVSGLALGVDAAAHVGALEATGFPIGVVGGGPDVVYPRANATLHEQVARRGLLVSELPPGLRPFRWSFPARNRIMAGLCEATVVVEAAEASGSLITTDFAQDLGRIVGAVPGPAGWVRSRGGNALLRAGAVVITRTEDVLDELYGIGAAVPAGTAGDAPSRGTADGETAVGESPDLPEAPAPAEGPEPAVLAALESGEGVDGACRATGLSVSAVRAMLARMEDSGRLERDGLGAYVRRAS